MITMNRCVGTILLGTFLIGGQAMADPVTDGNVPYLMDGVGTALNPSRYIVGENGAYDIDFGNSGIAVGLNNSWNDLLVRNGSTLSVSEGLWMGMNYGSNHNTATVDAATLRADSLEIGLSGNNNSLFVRNGGTVQVVAGNLRLGTFEDPMNPVPAGGDGNQLVVSGQGSSVTVSGILQAGVRGSNNSVIIENGGRVETGFGLAIGETVTADPTAPLSSGNRVLVTGTNSVLEVKGNNMLMVGAVMGSDNALHISDGGTVCVEADARIGNQAGVNNAIVVSGANSSLSAENLTMGAHSGMGESQVGSDELYIEDGGLVHVRDSMAIGMGLGGNHLVTVTGRDSILQVDSMLTLNGSNPGMSFADDGFAGLLVASEGLVKTDFLLFDANMSQGGVYLAGGYFAWAGNNVDELTYLMLNGFIQVWNPETGQWENALGSEYFAYGYFGSEEDAKAFSGYDGLAGYTIFTSVMVPEPATYALMLGGALAVVLLLRRRRS